MDVLGVDGCSGGWIAASRDPHGLITCTRVDTIAQLMNGPERPRVIAVDVPIGLVEIGARQCDVEARRLLGVRRNSVFPAPIRPILTAKSYLDALNIGNRVEGKGLSKQAWAIVPKIVEVDGLLRADPKRQEIVREVHPEVCFYHLNGKRPMSMPKRTAQGHSDRITLLRQWGGSFIDAVVATRRDLRCQPDDIVDAMVALWTAERVERGIAISIPTTPPLDMDGLRMELMA
jgi:predicted RNase H-like nuclease